MHAARSALRPWLAMWRASISGFEVDSLWLAGRTRWSASWTDLARSTSSRTDVPWEDAITAEVFTITSPDSALDLEIDTYQAVTEHAGEISVGGEPDSRSVLYDRKRSRETVLEFSGTAAGQHWGQWLDAHRFVLAGWSDATEFGHWKQGWISVYSGRDSSVATYVTRLVPDTTFDHYREAWEEWIKRRYRAIRSRRPA